ncbi:type VI secretion system protein [Desulfosarcina alkanivorans]|uniref:Type VI secretion system protein n=1 Tax=Desulfosarcina alkanivorans TaxID=571177 RepID=A0A5K7YFF0_9BACT|nr:type VI secretion system baseplate subunit TssF [Desulfosarcina alkanivorans]BBO67195.1 type VI secretion system protein [Desulfosarcina alkanivorans]
MEDRLLDYYERELTFIREMGAEFARKYPKIAGRLLLEGDKCEDPHTERMIEAFALISGRIHKKIDDDFPEITESLLNIIYPHYINPVPSMSIVRFDPVKQNIQEAGYRIDKGTALFSKPVRGTPCRFSTTQAVQIWPVSVVDAQIEEPKKMVKGAVQVIAISMQSFNKLSLSKIDWQSLRFFLNGPHQHVFHLYELLFNHVCHIECEVRKPDGENVVIPLVPNCIRPVGFAEKEGMLPYSKRSFPGYLLLFEYFCFPEKFLFFDLGGLDQLKTAAAGDRMTVRFFFNRLGKSDLVVNADTFQLNASPVANLFQRIAEPIRVEHRKTEYQVVPDVRRQKATEVYSVDKVTATLSGSAGGQKTYRPFYSMRHHLAEDETSEAQTFWHIQRRPSGKKGDLGTDVFLSFSDLNLKPSDPAEDILTVRATCTNRDLPSRLPFGDARGDFNMETAAPVSKVICVLKPTPTRRPFLGSALQWRLVSHFSLNYMSLVEKGEHALKEILRLYDFNNSLSTQQVISGIVSVNSRHITKRIKRSFCRGVQVTITFDEDKYVGTGIFLFACVLERFLSQYVSVNSFSQLVMKTLQQEEAVKIWPPRSGNQILI